LLVRQQYSGRVDVDGLSSGEGEPGVVHAPNIVLCSEGGQSLIREAVKEYGLTGIVICACSPRMHENTFRKAAAAAGVNLYGEIANIREHCAWIHKDKDEATEKPWSSRTAVAKLR
jgi:heterodisulfide reductase subunit A